MPEPRVAQRFPYSAAVEAGKTYYWCACGQSANQPFRDGSHKGSGLVPKPFTAEKDGDAWLCGCKATKKLSVLRRLAQGAERGGLSG